MLRHLGRARVYAACTYSPASGTCDFDSRLAARRDGDVARRPDDDKPLAGGTTTANRCAVEERNEMKQKGRRKFRRQKSPYA